MDNKQNPVSLFFVAALFFPIAGVCSFPSLEEASALFSAEQMNATNVWLTSQPYSDFKNRFYESASEGTRQAVEDLMIDAITSIVVRISTNEVSESTGTLIAEDRGWYFQTISNSFRTFPTNSFACLVLADYVGHVEQVDFPTNLAMMRGTLAGRKMFISTNETEMAQWMAREEAAIQERDARLREILARRNLQRRVLLENRAVGDYRNRLLSICARGVAGCRGIMDDEEFAAFTNQIVTASKANEQEREILFRRIVDRMK